MEKKLYSKLDPLLAAATLRRKSKDWLGRNQDNVSRLERHVYPWTVISLS
jgi:hypothetical protein